MTTYDVLTVGGGVGGSALAKVLAEQGYRVLVVEREEHFRDRVRGELVFPWGVAEMKELGIYDAMLQAGANLPKYWADYAGSDPLLPREFDEDTPQRLRALCMYHPKMQEAMLELAAVAGAEVRRGVRVSGIERGQVATVRLEGGGAAAVSARLVVGADGSSSRVRGWGGFRSRSEPSGNVFAGVLVEGVPASPDSSVCMLNPLHSRMVLYFPQSSDIGRAYLASRSNGGVRFRGGSGFELFLEECARSGLRGGVLDGARQAGPLATFTGEDSWVDHPYDRGVTLIGDAAAASDPTWGQGLSLTMRDVRELRDALLADEDWDAAGRAYAAAHDVYYSKVKTTNSWFTEIFLTAGPEADALRARVLPQMETDPFLLPDTQVAGPELAPPTDEHRARIFGTSPGNDHAGQLLRFAPLPAPSPVQ